MKKIIFLLFLFLGIITNYAQQQNATFIITPSTFEEDDQITITVSGVDPSIWGVTDVYLWAWYFEPGSSSAINSPTNGDWTNSDESQKFTDNGDGTYSFTFTPTIFYNATGIDRIGMLAKAKDGSGDKKTQDNIVDVGIFEFLLVSPIKTINIVEAGETLEINASTSVPSDFTLSANGVVVDTQEGITDYSNSYIITEDTSFNLEATQSGTSNSEAAQFSAILAPEVTEAPVPAGMQMELILILQIHLQLL